MNHAHFDSYVNQVTTVIDYITKEIEKAMIKNHFLDSNELLCYNKLLFELSFTRLGRLFMEIQC